MRLSQSAGIGRTYQYHADRVCRQPYHVPEMSKLDQQAQDLSTLEAALRARADGSGARLSGPLRVLSAASGTDGGRTYEVSTSVLLPVDEDDPALRDVSIPVPVTTSVHVDRDGSVGQVAVPPVDAASAREARAFARALIANGAVRGLAPPGPVRRSAGPPVRPTHELTTGEHGERVIRRVGFAAAG